MYSKKGKHQYSTNFQKWNLSTGSTAAWSPPSSRADFEVTSAPAVAALVAAEGSVFGRRSGPAALSLSQSLGSTSPNPAPWSVLDTRGQGWPSLCALLFSYLLSQWPFCLLLPSLSKRAPIPAGQSLLLSPCWLFFPNNDFKQPLSQEITPPSPTFLLPWIRGFLGTQII